MNKLPKSLSKIYEAEQSVLKAAKEWVFNGEGFTDQDWPLINAIDNLLKVEKESK